MIILFACLVGWLNSSHVEKNIRHDLYKTARAAWAGKNTSMRVQLRVCLQGPQSLADYVASFGGNDNNEYSRQLLKLKQPIGKLCGDSQNFL